MSDIEISAPANMSASDIQNEDHSVKVFCRAQNGRVKLCLATRDTKDMIYINSETFIGKIFPVKAFSNLEWISANYNHPNTHGVIMRNPIEVPSRPPKEKKTTQCSECLRLKLKYKKLQQEYRTLKEQSKSGARVTKCRRCEQKTFDLDAKKCANMLCPTNNKKPASPAIETE